MVDSGPGKGWNNLAPSGADKIFKNNDFNTIKVGPDYVILELTGKTDGKKRQVMSTRAMGSFWSGTAEMPLKPVDMMEVSASGRYVVASYRLDTN